ncbi:MAG: alpha-amylase family glycosyl hydrolase [Lachnospiraceae bacterium]|nr:alpha-amylase family glycosyl hydrolase [Lachnospiraceae bacterium]MDY5741494.1 alpha-amylase family glycosyl hydrolase [Lachnospiraceae bacterium]
MPNWLKDAVFYEIYPQSFYDTNADGIGDLQGIIEKLDYIKSLGCNALWLNPFFESPFMDAGYDVSDYKKVAARYGTLEDAKRLFAAAHERGIRVLLDLVAGHTSDRHPWFIASKEADRNEFSDRYVWTNGAFVGIKDRPYMAGMSDRDGAYMLNFFASQPALNYGWRERTESWQSAPDSEAAIATREAIKDIMRFWLDLGADGFRCDMADSLVKNDDENKSATAAVWADIRQMLDRDYPEAAIVSEWSNPEQSINGGGFHADFYLDHWGNGYNTLLRDYEPNAEDNSYFLSNGDGDIRRFLDDYLPKYEKTREKGYISFFTCNHDTPRPGRTLSANELRLAYAFIFTMPGLPFLYYGDELGLKFREGLRSKEGGFGRTGSRTPMQWNAGRNRGFSEAAEEQLYLPVESEKNGCDVQSQEADKTSLLQTTRELIALRHRYEDLQADAPFSVILAKKDRPFVYRRGSMIVAVWPKAGKSRTCVQELAGHQAVYSIGEISLEGTTLAVDGPGFAVFAAL